MSKLCFLDVIYDVVQLIHNTEKCYFIKKLCYKFCKLCFLLESNKFNMISSQNIEHIIKM